MMAAFTRFCPKEKLQKWIRPLATAAAVAVDAVLVRWLPRKIAEKLEEGIILSVTDTISFALKTFGEKLVENNSKRKKK